MNFSKPIFFIFFLVLTSCASLQLEGLPITNIDNASEKQPNRAVFRSWQHTDPNADALPGMSVHRAHTSLLNEKEGSNVIVAIIDTGIDIDHEDLTGLIWVNTDEIPNNGIDDDKNGYVDDIHGWNFLGDSEGDQYELIRMLKSGKDFPEKKEALKQYADKIKSEIGDDDLETIIGNLTRDVYHYNESIKKSLSLSWNARTTGDNPDDFSQRFYGDSDIRPKHDDESHGTHVAGIVAANRNNTLGMKGVADKVAIMALRAVPNEGDEYDKDIAMSIRYAADNGADIVNMSFGKGFSPHSDKVREAIVYAESKGVLLVNAAGNDGENIDVVPTYPNDSVDNGPEVANNLITVGAIGPSLSSRMVAPFSNYGLNNVDIFAPGAIIYSTTPSNNYNSYSGTSMAAPAVSGVAALVKSYFPKLSPNAVKKVIMESGLPISMEVRVGASGMETQLNKVSRTGKIANAYNALLYASTHFKMLKKMK
ncbi:MAG: S8 family peptidase [Flavobacteriaceae bacterium]